MKPWLDILAACGASVSPRRDGVAGARPRRRHARPEAAFRIGLCRNADGRLGLESLVGGIPEIGLSCVVHSVSRRLSTRWLPPQPNEEPIAVVMRRPRREDLHVFYRACDASLVLYTLPEKFQSNLILISMQGDAAIRQATLGGKVDRIEFSRLEPGNYLVASFSTVNPDELQRQALLLREEGRYSQALTLLEEALELDPEDCVALTRKGYVLREIGRPDEAMAAVEEALKINPECAFSWRAKGALLRDAGEHQAGLDCYLTSLELDPTDHLCWGNKGNALLALRRDAEAQEAYETAGRVRELYPEEKH